MKSFNTSNNNVTLSYDIDGDRLDIIELDVRLDKPHSSDYPDDHDLLEYDLEFIPSFEYERSLEEWENKKISLALREVDIFKDWAYYNAGDIGVDYILALKSLRGDWEGISLAKIFKDFGFHQSGLGWLIGYNLLHSYK